MLKAWPFTFFLAVFSFIYGIASFVSDIPFFIGSGIRKLKQIEWLYTKFGPELTGILFVSLGALLLYFSINEFINQERDYVGLTAILLLRVVLVIAVIVYATITFVI